MLDGATALAIPTKAGQRLTVNRSSENILDWQSYDDQGNCWFHIELVLKNRKLNTLRLVIGTIAMEHTLIKILEQAMELNASFLSEDIGWKVTTHLDFPRNWGLGTSSTLINNIAQWAKLDAFVLLNESFGGSGYDIAAAQNSSPILYTRNQKDVTIKPITLNWNFTDRLHFVHLNQKQDSKEGIDHYRKLSGSQAIPIQDFSEITQKLIVCTSEIEFITLLETHEHLLSHLLKLESVKERLFSDYNGLVKSLGAWGGDFVLVTGTSNDMDYFKNKGYQTIISFDTMIK